MQFKDQNSGKGPSGDLMTEPAVHLSGDDLARYVARRMSPRELLSADDHLAVCEQCYAQLTHAAKTDGGLATAVRAFEPSYVEPSHLSYEQLESCADGSIGPVELEIAQSHLETCAQCAAELNTMREIATSGQVRVGRKARESAGMLARLPAWWRQPWARLALQASAVVVVSVLTGMLVTIPYRTESAQLRARLAELERNNEALKSEAAELEPQIAELRAENDALRQRGTGDSVISLKDGGNDVTLDPAGNLLGLETTARYRQAIRDALVSGRVRLPAGIAELRDKSGTLMSGSTGQGFKLLEPFGAVIENDRPTFKWTALEGVAGYTVAVFDSALKKVAESGSVQGTEWAPSTALARGQVYAWQVRAVKEGQEIVAPAPGAARARFKVLERAKLAEIASARQTRPQSHLLLGLIYADGGLLNEAEREFDALLKENPQSPVARGLLQSLKSVKK